VQAVTALAHLQQQVDSNVQIHALQAQLTDSQALATQRALDLNAALQLSHQRAATITQQEAELQRKVNLIHLHEQTIEQELATQHHTQQQHDVAIGQRDATIARAGEVILDLQQKLTAASTLAHDRSELAQAAVTLSTDTIARLGRVASAADTYKAKYLHNRSIIIAVVAVVAVGSLLKIGAFLYDRVMYHVDVIDM
jgi:hypothetical protein